MQNTNFTDPQSVYYSENQPLQCIFKTRFRAEQTVILQTLTEFSYLILYFILQVTTKGCSYQW